MELQNLRAELERLFELEDLIRLSQEALGLDPEKVGGTGAKSSYVRALTDYCEAHQSTEALCDAVLNERPDQSEAIEKISLLGIKFSDDLAVEVLVVDDASRRTASDGFKPLPVILD